MIQLFVEGCALAAGVVIGAHIGDSVGRHLGKAADAGCDKIASWFRVAAEDETSSIKARLLDGLKDRAPANPVPVPVPVPVP